MRARSWSADRDVLVVLMLAAAAILPLLPVWLKGLTPFWGDLAYIHFPWRAFDAGLLAEGRVPLWNPYLYFGMPQAATMQDSLFYPGSIPYFFFGFATATAIFHAVHYGLAAALTYLWLRSLRLRRSAAAGGALIFALGGILASNMPFLNHLAVLALLPALPLFFNRPVALALTLACAFLAGYPPFFIGAAVLAWGLSAARFSTCAKAGLLALALCACLVLPAVELVALSRRASGVEIAEALRFGFEPRDLVQWVSPLLLPWRAFNPSVEWWKCCYLGFAGWAAVLAGFAAVRRRRALFFFAIMILILVLILGGSNPLSLFLWTRLPLLRFIRYPGNLAYLALPVFAALAAAGLERLTIRRGLLALIAAELVVYGWGAFPAAPRSLFTNSGPLVERLQSALEGHRYLLSPRAIETAAGASPEDWRQRLYGLMNAPHRLRAAGNFGEPLTPRASYEFMDALYSAPSADAAAALFGWADIRLLLTREELRPSSRLKFHGRALWPIYETVEPAAPARLFSEEEGAALPAGIPGPGQSLPRGRSLSFMRQREDRFTVGSGPAAAGWAYVGEPLYPGWKTVLETPLGLGRVKAQPAAGAFQKVKVPAGPWRLRFRYDPPLWRWGAALSALTLAALALDLARRMRARA